MRTSMIALAAVSLATLAAPAFADDAAAAPASPFTVTGGATLTSDYRFRAISQTNKRFAIQGTLGVSHSSGFYVGTWGSSIDDYVANGGDQEIDLYAGYKHSWAGWATDMGVLYYYYPGSGGVNSDFFEPYINTSKSFGPVGFKVGGNFAWKQHGLAYVNARDGSIHDKGDGVYGYVELSAAVPNTGLTVTGHLGRSFERNYITFGTHYDDWSVTAAYTWKALTFSAAYVDADVNLYSGGPSLLANGGTVNAPSAVNRNITKGSFVGSIGVSF